MPKSAKVDETIETLLDLNGERYYLDNGYWVKFEAYTVKPTKHVPYGIRYSLTLHDRKNNRILGHDNAHQVKNPIKHRFRGRRIVWDHKHRNQNIFPYEYESAGQLMEDFWKEVLEITND